MLLPLREAGKPSLPLILLTLLSCCPPLREVGTAYLSERDILTKVLGSTFPPGNPLPRSCGATSPRSPCFPSLVGAEMAWTEVQRKGRGKGMSGVEHSLTATQQSITQLTQAIGKTLTPQGKGQGKGKAKGQGKGDAKPPGARKAENLKSLSERATPTMEEVSCLKCKAYNWTSRCVCRSCGTALPQVNKPSTPPPSSGPPL